MNDNELMEFLNNLDNIENEDERFAALFKFAGDMLNEELSKRNNEDYEVDPEGMEHFIEFASFLSKLAKNGNGRVEVDIHEPKETIAGITAYFTVFYLTGDELREFCKLLVWASAMSIDALVDGTVCISVRFAGVYRRKQG